VILAALIVLILKTLPLADGLSMIATKEVVSSAIAVLPVTVVGDNKFGAVMRLSYSN
jgi:hypothetical protein